MNGEPRHAHKQVRQAADYLKSVGFEFDNVDTNGHPAYRWPATGETVTLPTTPNGHMWFANVKTRAAKIAGVQRRGSFDRAAQRHRQATSKAGRDRDVIDYRNRVATIEQHERDEQRLDELLDIQRLMGAKGSCL